MVGYVGSATFTTHVGESEQGYALAGFIQDDWHVSHKLALSLGLRYDYQLPPYERNGGTSNFVPNVVDPATHLLGRQEFAGVDYGRSALNSDTRNFGPRAGFAYDISGTGKTVVRGGYAIFYPSIFNIQYFGNTSGFATTTTTYNPPGGNSNLPAMIFSQSAGASHPAAGPCVGVVRIPRSGGQL